MKEVWKDIPDFSNYYLISTHGRLMSFKVKAEGHILSQKNSKGDYFTVILQHGGLKRHTRMHRLVAEAFIPNPDNLPEVNHIDGNKQNNHVDNLEWITRKGNANDAIRRNPNMMAGMNHYNMQIKPRAIQQYSLDGKLVMEYVNATSASKATGVCSRNILQVASGDEYKLGLTRKQAGGFIWKLKDKTEGSHCLISMF